MKKTLNKSILRNSLLVIIIFLMLVSIFFNWQLRGELNNRIITDIEYETQLVGKEVDSFVSRYKEVTRVLLSKQELLDYIREVDSREVKRSHHYFDEVGILLNELQQMDEDVEHVWVGFNSINDYLIQDITFEQNDPEYIHYERPWYIAMVGNGIGEITVSPMYKSLIDGIYQVSILAPVMPKGYTGNLASDNIGQVGVDINLRHLTRFIANYRVGSSGYAIMVDEFGDYVVKPNGWSKEVNILDEEGDLGDVGSKVLFGEPSTSIVEHNNETYYVSYRRVEEAPWYVITYITVDEVNSQLVMFNTILVIILVIFVIIFALSVWFIRVQSSNKILEESNTELQEKEKELQLANFEMNAAYQQLAAQEESLRKQFDDIQEYTEKLEEQENTIKKLADIDPLTEIPNRRSFIREMENAIGEARPFAVMLLDLDNFKQLNDTMGHVFGDKLLKRIAKHIIGYASDKVFVSRFGGDEFLILYKHYGLEKEVSQFASELVKSFNNQFDIFGEELFVSVSMGIALYPQHSETVDELIMYADTAMYKVKSQRKNDFILFTKAMSKSIIRRHLIEKTLRESLDNRQFKLVYQPIYDTVTEEVVSAEALIRLEDGQYSPGEFIPVAEDTGLILEIGRRVVKEVIRQQKEWQVKGKEIVPVALNFSASQINDTTFLEELKVALHDFALDGQWIRIEITESVFMRNKEDTIALLNELRSMGIKIALDDFGTGYSSISYLTFLPVDYLKLDKLLTDQLMDQKEFIKNIINLAHSCNMGAVAEGVEEREQVELLRLMSCNYIQGYYFSRPLENKEFSTLLKDKAEE